MDLDTLKHLIQTTPWFGNLGQAPLLAGRGISVSAQRWRQFVSGSTQAEFGLPHDPADLESFPFADWEWLPTTVYSNDPVHHERLKVQASREGRESAYKAARLEIFRLTQVALRGISEPPLLVIGPTNLTEAARGAALFACRTAAAELVLGQPDFWCDMVMLYHAGYWPFGRMESGEVVVL